MTKFVSFVGLSLILCGNISATEESGVIQENQSASATAKVYEFPHLKVNTGVLQMPEKGEPVEMALRFFELNQERYHIRNPREELVYQGTRGSKLSGKNRVDFKQVYRGVPVDAGARVWFDRNGNLESVKVTYYDITDLSTAPSISSAVAESLAISHLGFPKKTKIIKNDEYFTNLAIWRDNNGKFHLIWVVWVDQEEGLHAWKYYVDAHDGTVLERVDQVLINVPTSIRQTTQ
ncbi:MAG: hypothetical protein L0Y74_06105 [candidate division Zixibacteria bacterium]|nr:hypothetical protein [candidate division Zixibacteria bacterium]